VRTSFAIGLVAAAFSIVPAEAADLGRFPPAARFYPPPPPVLRVYNWTGCYLGAQVGGAFADNHVNGNFNTIVPVSPNGDGSGGGIVSLTTPLANNAGSTSVTAGGQGGCDLQFARNWVIGAQLDGAWTHLSGSQGINASAGLSEGGNIALTANALIKADILATATGRIGYAVNYDDIAGLFYLKGGAAFVNYDTYNITGNNAVTTCAVFDPTTGCKSFNSANNPFVFTAPSTNRWGWTIGLGTEWVVDGNWSIFGEWDYLNFGTHSVTFTDPHAGSTQLSVKQTINELKLGINYRFGNPLPGQYP
jgi:outer membrane immunogenic protein